MSVYCRRGGSGGVLLVKLRYGWSSVALTGSYTCLPPEDIEGYRAADVEGLYMSV